MLAMKEELQCFKEHDAWELCNSQQDGRAISGCFLKKRNNSDNKVWFRARLVAKGFSQIKGIDYTESSSPVMRHTTVCIFSSVKI